MCVDLYLACRLQRKDASVLWGELASLVNLLLDPKNKIGTTKLKQAYVQSSLNHVLKMSLNN